MPIPCQRDRFDIPEEVAYFNCAYMSPLPRASRAAGEEGIRRKSSPWRITPAFFFEELEEARGLYGALLGTSGENIALVPSVSYGMSVATANLPLRPGQRVLMLEEEFPSVIYAWQRHARRSGAEAVMIPRPPDDDWTTPLLAAIDERTALAALPVIHWTDGGLLDLARVRARLREVGAALVLDATQSVGAMPLDLAAVDPDFVAVASYKWLLGPYSTGMLYAAPRHHGGQGVEETWMARAGSEDFSALVQYRDEYRAGARRFDVGEPSNFQLQAAVVASLRQLLAWGIPAIYATLAAQAEALAARLLPLGFRAVAADRRGGHYLGVRRAGGLPAGLAGRLSTAGIYVSLRGDALRITPHLWTTPHDLDRLVAALAAEVG